MCILLLHAFLQAVFKRLQEAYISVSMMAYRCLNCYLLPKISIRRGEISENEKNKNCMYTWSIRKYRRSY